MKTLDFTGLKNVENVAKGLHQLLADFQVYYTNLRGLHWNIEGNQFYQLHAHFEDLYDDAAEKVDEIAERLLMLGETPAHNFSDYLKVAQVKESGVIKGAKESIEHILDTLKVLIENERAIIEAAGEINDEVTVALLSDYLVSQEKEIWMLTATLK